MSATQLVPDAYKDALYSRDVGIWLANKASAQDTTKYNNVFSEVKTRAQALKPPADQDASFINATLKKIQGQNNKPPLPPTNGWSYTATSKSRPATSISSNRPASAAPTMPATRPKSTDSLAAAARAAAAKAEARMGNEISNLRMRNRPASAPNSVAGSFASGSTSVRSHMPSDISTNQFTYGLKEMYPQLYKEAREASRSQPSDNLLFKSEWADTLKAGTTATHTRDMMQSTYTRYNKEVHKEEMERLAERNDNSLADWAVKQKLYYGDLMTSEYAPHVEALLKEGSAADKMQTLDVMRSLYSVVQPYKTKSHSQTVHRELGNPNDPGLMALIKEQNRLKNMGRPNITPTNKAKSAAAFRPASAPVSGKKGTAKSLLAARYEAPDPQAGVTHSGTSSAMGSRQGSATGSTRAAAQGARRPASAPKPARGAKSGVYKNNGPSYHVTDSNDKDTYKSTLPMKQAGSSLHPVTTTYEDFHGSLKPELRRTMMDSSQVAGYKPVEVTCPIGKINPYTTIKGFPELYPVPESFIRGAGPFPGVPTGIAACTTKQLDFQPRDEADVIRSVKAAQQAVEFSHKALEKSGVPLGAKGIDTTPADGAFKSEYGAEYHKFANTASEDRARREALHKMFLGPTAAVGAVVDPVPKAMRAGSAKTGSPQHHQEQ